MDPLVPWLLKQLPGEPPHCHSCREGAGAHQRSPHSWVLPHCKAIKSRGNFRTWAGPPGAAGGDTSGLGLLTFLGNASKSKGDGEIFERRSSPC